MASKTERIRRSLTQYFEPPENCAGVLGWICGYSADASFLEAAAERFSGQTRAVRESQGQIFLMLMLDPSNRQICVSEAPGVIHLAMAHKKPFALLHSKVAILLFYNRAKAEWLCRLLVSTANWTKDSLDASIDLIWGVDISETDLRIKSDETAQLCADFGAATAYLSYVKSLFDVRIISLLPLLQDANAKFDEVTSQIINAKKATRPRFFDNREKSMLQQLPTLIRTHAGDSTRNYLAMGSGFFQSNSKPDSVPSVLGEIVSQLQTERYGATLLASRCEIDVYVNPSQCQSVAGSAKAMKDAGWNLQKPKREEFGTRQLHAKFLFSSYLRNDSDKCNSAWVYLGSANLTSPGFCKPASAGGNLEAGVLFAPDTLYRSSKGRPSDQVLSNLLPIDYDAPETIDDITVLARGAEMPEMTSTFAAAPCAYLQLEMDNGRLWLKPQGENGIPFDVLSESGEPCDRNEVMGFAWPTLTAPRQVRSCWETSDEQHEAVVPVVDEYGRVAAAPLEPLRIDDAWWQLAGFPMAPDIDDLADGRVQFNGQFQGITQQSGIHTYPIRDMMQLLENISDKQTRLLPFDWTLWCHRLEQSLIQASKSEAVEEFRKMGINPVSVLRRREFRPIFAEDETTDEGKDYEAVLRRIEEAWKVDGLAAIGSAR